MKKRYYILIGLFLLFGGVKYYLFHSYEQRLNRVLQIFSFEEAKNLHLIGEEYTSKNDLLNGMTFFIQVTPEYSVDFFGGVELKPSNNVQRNRVVIEQKKNILDGVVLTLEKGGQLNLRGENNISVDYGYSELKAFYSIDLLDGSPDSIKVYLHEYKKLTRDDEIYHQLKGFVSSDVFVSKRLIDSTYLYKVR